METVKGYELITEWKASNRGWTAKAKKGGKVYFLKKYNQYVMPKKDGSCSETLYRKRTQEFNDFKKNREDIIDALEACCGDGGNIIIPQDRFVYDGYYIEATEFVNDLIDEDAICKLPAEDKILIMKTASAALATVHKKNVIHSDLKISNIMAAKNGMGKYSAKLIDFDMSYFEGNVRPDELGGDQVFMSPELCDAIKLINREGEDSPNTIEAMDKLTTKSDIFSLGLVFHRYLTGKMPTFEGLSDELMEEGDLDKVYCADALLSSETSKLVVCGDIPEKYLRHVIATMIQYEPELRPTAQEVLDALKEKKVLDLKSDSVWIEGEENGGHAPDMPEGFCEPWPEHKITFDEDKMKAGGFVASEQAEVGGNKVYAFYTSDAKKRIFNLSNVKLLGFAVGEGGAKPSSTTTLPSAPPPTKSESWTLWEDDDPREEYTFDKSTASKLGYGEIIKAQRGTQRGYVLVKNNGTERPGLMSFGNLKMLGIVVKK